MMSSFAVGYVARSAPRPRSAATRSPKRSTPSYTPPPKTDHSYSSGSSSNYGEGMTSHVVDAIVDAFKFLRTTKELPVAAPDTNSSASISCVTQAKAFQDCLDEFETDITKCQLYMNMWSQCKKRNSDSKLSA
ncbi:unnamed protein product [Microthlaspi erraticum]|uniref:CHCH domain-containing protein n=1 Tax=Microthlaspi erraticum TaxID=1685480 RepID=A0A6D2IGD2_9BRAS|nr:unnamed protein product [Microthlaspi erraticum]